MLRSSRLRFAIHKHKNKKKGVFDLSLQEWICVEDHLKPFSEVTVICDQVFSEISGIPAAIHRVTKSSTARLSIVYEIRPIPGISKEVYKKIKVE